MIICNHYTRIPVAGSFYCSIDGTIYGLISNSYDSYNRELYLEVTEMGCVEAAKARHKLTFGEYDEYRASDCSMTIKKVFLYKNKKARRSKRPAYNVVVRWLGAFGPQRFQQSLTDAIQFELEGHQRQVAAEPILGRSAIKHARVGLLVDRRHVLKVHDGDVWSIRKGKSLVPTQEPQGYHMEAFCNQVYKALVVKGEITSSARLALEAISKESGLPILSLYAGNKINPELKALQ